MADTKAVVLSKARTPETEKVTVNVGYVDLGHIDLLVNEGFYSNRTDFIRTAIRNQLVSQKEAVRQVVTRKALVLGLAIVDDDVSPELASATIASVTVLGAFQASPAVKLALRGRIQS